MEKTGQVLRRVTRVTVTGLVVNLVLSASKLAAGILSRSQALLADGVHSLSDCVTDIAIIVGARYWTKPRDASHPHGHARIETIITGFIGAFIIVTGLIIAWESLQSIIDPSDVPPGWPAFGVAFAAVVLKGFLSRWTMNESKSLRSPALAANAVHQRSDMLSSIPVAIVVLAARLQGSLIILDGVGGAMVAIMIVRMGIGILRPALWQLSDTAAPEEIVEELRRIALSVQGVKDVHNLRTRYQGDGLQTDMHIVVDGGMPLREAFSIVKEVERKLRDAGPGVVDAMVRLEPDSVDETSG